MGPPPHHADADLLPCHLPTIPIAGPLGALTIVQIYVSPSWREPGRVVRGGAQCTAAGIVDRTSWASHSKFKIPIGVQRLLLRPFDSVGSLIKLVGPPTPLRFRAVSFLVSVGAVAIFTSRPCGGAFTEERGFRSQLVGGPPLPRATAADFDNRPGADGDVVLYDHGRRRLRLLTPTRTAT